MGVHKSNQYFKHNLLTRTELQTTKSNYIRNITTNLENFNK